MVVLARFADCTEFYRGEHQGQSSFVVGQGYADVERLFKRSQLAAASEYAKATNMTVTSVANSSLCAAAVDELWAEL
jgi:hypothetical protein